MEGRRLYINGGLAGIALASAAASVGMLRRVDEGDAAARAKALEAERLEQKAKAETVEAVPTFRQDSGLKNRMTVEQAMAQTGTSTPRQALHALRAQGLKRMAYTPHVGAKERAKAAKRLAKMQARNAGG